MLSLSLTIQKSVFVIEFCSSPIPMVQCLDIISIHGITADMITSERRENVLETSFYRTVSPSTSLESPATFSPFSIQKVAPTKKAKLFFSLFWSRSFLQSIEREKNGKNPKKSGLRKKNWEFALKTMYHVKMYIKILGFASSFSRKLKQNEDLKIHNITSRMSV